MGWCECGGDALLCGMMGGSVYLVDSVDVKPFYINVHTHTCPLLPLIPPPPPPPTHTGSPVCSRHYGLLEKLSTTLKQVDLGDNLGLLVVECEGVEEVEKYEVCVCVHPID